MVLPVLILVVVSISFLLIRSNIFIIRSVEAQLEKAACTDAEQIKNSSKLLGQNFFFINSSKVESDLKRKFLCIKSVKISRYFPNRVILQIFGREPAAILVMEKNEEVTAGEIEEFSKIESTPSAEASISAKFSLSVEGPTENFLVDNDGVIYSNNIEQINAPRIYVSGLNLTLGQEVKENLIKGLLKILEKVKIFGVDVKDAKIYSKNILLINTKPKMIFKLDDKIDTQIASLQLILGKAKIDSAELEFIDLRFDKPIVRFAPKKK